MSTTFDESWQAQEDAIYSMLTSAAVPGGLLDGIVGVDRVSPPEGDPPSRRIGFQYQSTVEGFQTNAKRVQTNTFELTIVVVNHLDLTRTDTARAAFESVAKFVNDRNGNGVLPLLRSNPTLYGSANWSVAQNQQIEVGQTGPDDPELTSIFRIQIVAEGEIYV